MEPIEVLLLLSLLGLPAAGGIYAVIGLRRLQRAEPPRPATPVPAVAAPTPSSQEDWEAMLGRNWFAKLGSLALVIGLAFLLRYSFSHMGAAGIVAISLAGSAAMLAAGVAFEPRERYRIFARALISGGWAGLYVTVYSMHVVSAAKIIDNPYLAGILLIAVAAGMIVHSLRYRSEIVTGLAYFIAFFTLVITQIASLSLVSLIPLAASILFIANHFRWSRMALGGMENWAAPRFSWSPRRPKNWPRDAAPPLGSDPNRANWPKVPPPPDATFHAPDRQL